MLHTLPKLHNAMWPGVVGKGDEPGLEPPLGLQRMLDLTGAAEVGGQKFDGVDCFLFLPHSDPDASDDELRRMADSVEARGFAIGSLVAPVPSISFSGRPWKISLPPCSPARGPRSTR